MTESNTQDEAKTTETLHDVFDVIVEASQDPEHHPVFEQLRQHINPSLNRYANVWDAVCDTPEEATKMKFLSTLKMRFNNGENIEGFLAELPVGIKITDKDITWVKEQFPKSIKTQFQKDRDSAIGIVNLAFSDEVNAAGYADSMAMFDRIERGESTFEEEDARLMIQWRALKAKIKNNKNHYEKDKSNSCFRILKIPVVLHTDDGIHFGVTVPDVAGCFSAGDSFDDALENVHEALVLHFESMRIDGDSLPCINSIEHHKNNPDYHDGVWAYVNFEF